MTTSPPSETQDPADLPSSILKVLEHVVDEPTLRLASEVAALRILLAQSDAALADACHYRLPVYMRRRNDDARVQDAFARHAAREASAATPTAPDVELADLIESTVVELRSILAGGHRPIRLLVVRRRLSHYGQVHRPYFPDEWYGQEAGVPASRWGGLDADGTCWLASLSAGAEGAHVRGTGPSEACALLVEVLRASRRLS